MRRRRFQSSSKAQTHSGHLIPQETASQSVKKLPVKVRTPTNRHREARIAARKIQPARLGKLGQNQKFKTPVSCAEKRPPAEQYSAQFAPCGVT